MAAADQDVMETKTYTHMYLCNNVKVIKHKQNKHPLSTHEFRFFIGNTGRVPSKNANNNDTKVGADDK